MASIKTELKKHIEYLGARRSGAEHVLNFISNEEERAKVREFAKGLTESLQINSSKLAQIEAEEKRIKAEEKAEAAARKKARAVAD